MQLRALLLVLAATAFFASQGFAQAPAAVRIRGEIVAVDASTLTVQRRGGGGTVKIAFKPDAVVAVKNVALADIKPGSYVGIASKPGPGGKLVAMEVLVFPEAARGTAEGHSDWDLAPGSTMTNANVDTVVESVDGRTMKLSYKGGSKEVTVPSNAPVVTPAPATAADLIPGKKVVVFTQGDPSSLNARRVYVEKDGVAPPM